MGYVAPFWMWDIKMLSRKRCRNSQCLIYIYILGGGHWENDFFGGGNRQTRKIMNKLKKNIWNTEL